MSPALLAVGFLGAMVLPPHVGSPGSEHIALGGGLEGGAPAVDVRAGLAFVALTLEGVWHEDAPLVGGQLRLAAGRTRGGLFANAWAEGHLRPVLTTEVTRSLAGSDLGLGLGVVVVNGWANLALDGGVALGIPVVDVHISGLEETAIDQQGGLFALQRLTFGVDLGDHFEIAARGSFGLPVDSVHFNRRNQDVLGRWDTRLGLRALVRF